LCGIKKRIQFVRCGGLKHWGTGYRNWQLPIDVVYLATEVQRCLCSSTVIPDRLNWNSSRQQIAKNLGAFAQRTIDRKLSVRVQDIKHQIRDWHVAHQGFAYLLASEPLLKSAEWKRAANLCRRPVHRRARSLAQWTLPHQVWRQVTGYFIVPRQNLAIENRIVRKAGQRVREF